MTNLKTFVTLLLVMVASITSNARTVWEGSQEVDWTGFTLTTEQIGSINAGDYFVFTYTVTDPENWPQFRLEDLSYNVQEGVSLSAGMTESRIYVTPGMITALASGARVRGTGCTMTKIDLIDGDGGDYTNAIWIGEKVYPSNWSEYLTLNASTFVGKSGWVLRAHYKSVKAGAQMNFSYTAWDSENAKTTWSTLPGTSGMTVDGAALQITLDDDMIAAITTTEDGESHTGLGTLHISGINFTLTSVDLIDPTTLKTLTCSVPVTNNWVWTSDDYPSFTVNIQNDNAEAVTANAQVIIVTDQYGEYKTVTDSKSIDANSSDVMTITLTEKPAAGIYRATVVVNDETVRAFNFAYAPTEIVSAPDKQADFDSYWQTAKTQLAAVEADDEPVLTEITSKSTAARKVYLVEFKSVPDGLTGDAVTVRGYYCEPTDGEKHPVIMHYLGYDSGYRPGGEGTTPYCPSGDANPGYAEFYLSTRGQSVNNRKASEREDGIDRDFTNTYGDWFAFNFGDKDSYYYRGAYMDCVRAIDFMATRTTSDMDNLFAEGQSQGGAFTYAAAALSGRTFNAIAPAITFMGDFPDYFNISNWPAYVARENQGTMTDEEMYAFLSYFDTKNLATLINCPVITSIGIQDNVCPAHTNIAPYNNLQTAEADKQIVYNAELYHQVNGEWFTTYSNFFESYETVEDAEVIWSGSVTLDDTWSQYKALSYNDRAGLANARMTDVIRVTLTTTAEGAQIQLKNPNKGWELFSDDAAKLLTYSASPQTFEYTISSAAVLEDIQITGIIVAGINFTVTKVELVKPAGRYDAASVTIGSDGIATYSSNAKKLDFRGTGVTPYYASAVATGTVTLTSVETTWDWQGYIVRGEAGTYDIPVTDEATYPSTNYLKPTGDYAQNLSASTANEFRYIFAKNSSGEIGFYKLTAAKTLAAHRAYLQTDVDITPAAGDAKIEIIFDNETDVITQPTTYDLRPTTTYNLSGQRVGNDYKGLVIINGKKVIRK